MQGYFGNIFPKNQASFEKRLLFLKCFSCANLLEKHTPLQINAKIINTFYKSAIGKKIILEIQKILKEAVQKYKVLKGNLPLASVAFQGISLPTVLFSVSNFLIASQIATNL